MLSQILTELRATSNSLITLLSSFDREKFNAIPFQGSWTAAQIGDHLLKSYAVVDALNGKVKETIRPADEKVQRLKDLFLNFEVKMQSHEFILPSEKRVDKEALLSSLEHRISQLIKITETDDLSMICLDFVIPGLGEMTRLEWVNFMIFHTQRHIHQLAVIHQKLYSAE